MSTLPAELIATSDDYVLAYGKIEAIESTNLDDASATRVNEDKLQLALDDAFAMCMGYDAISNNAGKVLIRRRLRRLMLAIARFFLDTLKGRPDIRKEYEDAIKLMQDASEPDFGGSVSDKDLEDFGILPSTADRVLISSNERIYTQESLKEYREGSYLQGPGNKRLEQNYSTKWR